MIDNEAQPQRESIKLTSRGSEQQEAVQWVSLDGTLTAAYCTLAITFQ